jgi:hypothetical protein
MLDGEHERTFVLSREMDPHYLEFAPEHLREAAILLLDAACEWASFAPAVVRRAR